MLYAGPASASAGPDWKHFCGTPLSGVCKYFEEGHQVIIMEMIRYLKERGPKRKIPS